MKARELTPPTADALLLAWLLVALAERNRTRVKQLLRSGRVLVNGASVTRHDHPLKPGDRVAISHEAPAVRDPNALAILFEDSHLIVIDKPAGLLSVATEGEKTDTAFVRLSADLAKRNAGRPFVVHRLDRETSGLLMFARSAEVRDSLQANWDAVRKTYLAVVEGTPEPREGVIDNFLTEGRDLRVRVSKRAGPDAKRAVTRYKVVSSHGRLALVEVTIETGRKHQIRAHLANLGYPVSGDRGYGASGNAAGRLALHAWRLALEHPVTGERVEVESTLPLPISRLASDPTTP